MPGSAGTLRMLSNSRSPGSTCSTAIIPKQATKPHVRRCAGAYTWARAGDFDRVVPWATALNSVRSSLSALAACLVVLVSSPAAHAESDALEYAVKATYLYKFGPFIGWPATAFESPSKIGRASCRARGGTSV